MTFGHVRSLASSCDENFLRANEAPRPAPPPPRFARCASSSGPPPPLRGGGWCKRSHSRDAYWRPSFSARETRIDRALEKYDQVNRETGRSKERAGVGPVFRSSIIPVSSAQSKKMKEAERRQTLILILRILRCGSRLMTARSSDGVPPRLSPKGIIPSQRLSFRPGFLGRGLHGRYPPSPVPVQGCTSHPGHNAGRHDAQAARERTANPPAGTALAPMTRCASASCPSMSEDCEVTGMGTFVKGRL